MRRWRRTRPSSRVALVAAGRAGRRRRASRRCRSRSPPRVPGRSRRPRGRTTARRTRRRPGCRRWSPAAFSARHHAPGCPVPQLGERPPPAPTFCYTDGGAERSRTRARNGVQHGSSRWWRPRPHACRPLHRADGRGAGRVGRAGWRCKHGGGAEGDQGACCRDKESDTGMSVLSSRRVHLTKSRAISYCFLSVRPRLSVVCCDIGALGRARRYKVNWS